MDTPLDALLAPVADHYAIEREVGRGGMGIVYRGRDLKLGRPVAVKMILESSGDDAALTQRLRREARILASLHHPHIASVYALEEPRPGCLLLILEWIEGETLAQRLAAGPLPVHDALETCRQVADALGAAHERRVIHRDLKPSNVMFAVGEGVKVLDFGVARQISSRDESTTTRPITDSGDLVGTPRYMSPEQICCEPLDTRSDVFSFGSLLFECLAGRPAFDGRSAPECLAAVLHVEPPWGALPAGVPQAVRRLLFNCLAKDREKRPRDIRDVGRALVAALDPSRSAEDDAAPSALPHELTRFVGRQDALARCEVLMADHRLVTLTGPGGAGKTRLALQLAQRARAQRSCGVHLVDLVPIADPRRVEHAVGAALRVEEEPDRPVMKSIETALRDRPTLLVFDNCEHVVDACAAVARSLLSSCPNLSILATSREPLGIPGEQNFPVPPLSVPATGSRDIDVLFGSEAVQLFLDRARLIEPDFVVDAHSVTAVAEVCRRLDGIPLAIEIAAARVRALSVEQIQKRLDDRFRLLPGKGDARGRHETLEATFQWGYDLLEEEERRRFRALAVFSGGWTLDAAAWIWGLHDDQAALEGIEQLVSKSLVGLRSNEGASLRYRLLETLRQFAWARIEASGEVPGLRDRHLHYFITRSEAAEQELWGPKQAQWLEWLDREHDNLLWALDWGLSKPGEDDSALRLAGSLRRFWNIRGHYGVGFRALEAALEHDRRANATPARGKALDGFANLALYAGRYAQSKGAFEESLTLHRDLNDPKGVARALTGLGHVASQQREYDTARSRYEESLATSRALEDAQGVAAALGNLGGVATVQGDYRTANTLMVECVGLFERMGNLHNTAIGLASLGFLATKLGDTASARHRLRKCLMLVRDLRAARACASALEAVAESAQASGDLEDAARFFGAADNLRVTSGSPLGPDEKRQQDEIVGLVRSGLGSTRFDVAWSEGRALGFDAAVAAGLRWLGEPVPEPGGTPA